MKESYEKYKKFHEIPELQRELAIKLASSIIGIIIFEEDCREFAKSNIFGDFLPPKTVIV